MRRLATALLASVLLAIAGPAAAQAPVLDTAAQALKRDPVYVDNAAERARDVSADRLRQRIRSGGDPIFVAVVPAAAASETGGEPGLLPAALGRKVGFPGTYAVLAGNSFRAASNVLPAGQAETLATTSFQAHSGDGPAAVLEDFVARVGRLPSGTGAGSSSGTGGGTGSAGSGSSVGLLALLVVAGGGLFLWSRSRRRRRDAERHKQLAADRQLLQAELSVLGDDVLALEPDVTMHPDARADYDAGVTRFKSAEAALAYADDQVDLGRVGRVIEEGRYAMARTRALVQGRQPPPPPPELARPGGRNEPALDVDDAGAVRYAGYGDMPFYGGGWFGGGSGGLLTGLLLGQMMGGGGWGWGGGGWYDRGDGPSDDGASDSDGGDFGGGDFGGGDFGGGDFGGGDFGGGDF